MGTDVGPALMDVKMKPPEALLTDILDPNRAFEERWVSWTVSTTDGRTLTGLVQSDAESGIKLKLSGGLVEAIPRSEIKKISATGFSLMPAGLEAAISPSDMAHLIAFLKQR